ncbi:hypothetical protein LguiB_028657 [Lonicera macranthoides]
MHPINILAFFFSSFSFLLNVAYPSLVSAQNLNLNFNFSSLTLRNLTLLGDSHLRNGVIGVTREDVNLTSFGHGSFFLSSNNETLSSSGGYLGLENFGPDPECRWAQQLVSELNGESTHLWSSIRLSVARLGGAIVD